MIIERSFEVFKIVSNGAIGLLDTFRKKIERRINSISYDWNNFSNIQKRWKTLKLRFESESNEKLIHLKNVICPILEIEYFNGTYDFGEKLPSIDESLPIKGQQRKNDHFSEIKNGMISQMLNSINYRKEELLEKEHSMVWMNGRSSQFRQYRRFIGFNVSESLWSKLVSET